MNAENLVPLNKRPAKEARAIRSKGGKACGEKRRKRAMLRDLAREVLAMPVGKGRPAELEELHTLEEAGGASLSVAEKAVIMAAMEAIDENAQPHARAKAREWLFNLANEATGQTADEALDFWDCMAGE